MAVAAGAAAARVVQRVQWVAPRAPAERLLHRVRRLAARRRADAAPAVGAGLPDLAQVVFLVADFAHRSLAVDVHAADLAGAHAQLGILALAREKLHAGAGG